MTADEYAADMAEAKIAGLEAALALAEDEKETCSHLKHGEGAYHVGIVVKWIKEAIAAATAALPASRR